MAATDEGAGTAANNGMTPSSGAELHDTFGKKAKAMTSRQGEAVLEVRDLPNGLYNLRISQGSKTVTKHIKIAH